MIVFWRLFTFFVAFSPLLWLLLSRSLHVLARVNYRHFAEAITIWSARYHSYGITRYVALNPWQFVWKTTINGKSLLILAQSQMCLVTLWFLLSFVISPIHKYRSKYILYNCSVLNKLEIIWFPMELLKGIRLIRHSFFSKETTYKEIMSIIYWNSCSLLLFLIKHCKPFQNVWLGARSTLQLGHSWKSIFLLAVITSNNYDI